MQWSFSSKASTPPQFLSFTAPQEEKRKEDVHGTSSFMTISTADGFNSNQKSFPSASQDNQKKIIHEKQAGNHYGIKVCSIQNRGVNQITPISLSTPVLQHNVLKSSSMVNSTIKPQPLAGVPVVTPVSAIPYQSSIVGTTDLRNVSDSSGMPAQLTIFYGGVVNVFHDISPEKAQAIMLLAGDGSSPAYNKLPSHAQVQTPFPSPSISDGFFGNQSQIAPSISNRASPISVTSHANSLPGRAFNTSHSVMVSTPTPTATSTSSINRSEPSNVVTQSVITNFIPTVPVPQARKASLARFFEKRKERMTSALPYNLSKKSQDSSTTGFEMLSFSLNMSGSCPVQTTK